MAASNDLSDHAIMILTCDDDSRQYEMLIRGLEHFWPEMPRVVMYDNDAGAESDLPSDIRSVVSEFVNLRRVFDLPLLSGARWLHFMDTDFLVFRKPSELLGPCYLPSFRFKDQPSWGRVWSKMGVTIPRPAPQFCGALYTIRSDEMREHRDEAIEYVRVAKRLGMDPYLCYEGIVSGIWRRHYPNNPLDRKQYTQLQTFPGLAMMHLGVRSNHPNATVQSRISRLYEYYDMTLSREETRNG